MIKILFKVFLVAFGCAAIMDMGATNFNREIDREHCKAPATFVEHDYWNWECVNR